MLRFEDTDQERSKREWEEVIISEMQWLGLDWDEGPDIGGPFAPYYQTARMSLYQEHFEMLKEQEAVYPCYCTPEELAEERKEADRQKVAYKYSRRCLALTQEEQAKKETEGRRPVWRLFIPDNQLVAYDDLLRGRIEFHTNTISDPVIMRASGVPLYNFAVVVDDLTMHITDVVRGEGHISNTPIQVLIYRALEAEPPRFAHCSHLLNAGRGKISKRKGEMSVRSFRERGILSETLFNYLALLGWTPKEEGKEFLTKEEIIRDFHITDVSRSAAIFDEEKLQWMNGIYLRGKTREVFAELSLPFVVEAGLASEKFLRDNWAWFVNIAALVQERVRLLDEVPPYIDFFFTDEIENDEKAVNKFLSSETKPFIHNVTEALKKVEWDTSPIEKAIRATIDDMALKPKDALLALRVAISGRTVSPPLFESIFLIKRQQVIARLANWM
ncbi:glutamate--tRNA ligase [Ktedonobacter robiniae]|uniref:Glutamate--tRNA ligase n=1 Tax=Ktedonobacter robiniae TaxID=2778365 RepID=A0ABQ3V3N8_9CHLR|nr:glutamate--tRNA ligase [Ktedonobacter robiniae]